MEPRLKQRLIGAVVLVALAVIFLPMLLSGPVERTRVDIPMEIPPQPAIQPAPELPAPGGIQQPPPARELAEAPEPVLAPAPEPDTEQVEPAPPEPPDVPVAPEQAAEPPPEPAERAPAAVAQPAEPSEPPAGGPTWVVQVGGFRNRDNALRLRERLRGADFPAFVDRTEWQGGPLYRVRIGPVLTREEATELASAVQERYQMEALILQP